jgi:hypothetical protein
VVVSNFIDEHDDESVDAMIAALTPKKYGGEGSGNWGHEGRPGEVGGSLPSGSFDPTHAGEGIWNGPSPEAHGTPGTSPGGQRQLPGVPRPPQNVASPERSIAKATLASGKVVGGVEDLGGGVNTTKLITLEDGTQGVFKPQSGEAEGMRGNVPSGEYYLREAAASDVAEVLGVDDIVPPVVVRSLSSEGVGSVHQYINDTLHTGGYYGDANEVDDPDHDRIAAFDYVIGNEDRHSNNWLRDDDATRVVLIDHGLSFPTDNDGYFRSEFTTNAQERRSSISDAIGDSWDGKWPQIEKMLEARSLGKDAISATQARYDDLMRVKNEGGHFGQLKFEFGY